MTRKTIDQLLTEARDRIDRLTPAEALAEQRSGAIVVDTRCATDRAATGVIPGSVHIPRTVLEWRADPASAWSDPRISNLDARLVLVCSDGFSSSLAVATLADLGFARAADIIGGVNRWAGEGLPLEHIG